ncbi:chromate efflux transporter [Cupriavidus sp. AU9028]|uniref:chromate efflux transporter n=1 Tax=Cupriavidus sp. AU9028 TaxID=2871157 RepID=UPI001C948907|nr:chromate efflux transporter [Cupriavidus sp. AU9028]MBY4895963.1 chromate efflux transporter [Cupriavidus sp. AU9028]
MNDEPQPHPRAGRASTQADAPAPTQAAQPGSAWQVFLVFLRLGLTSFGGPVAHLGYFREAFVVRRQWLSDAAYAELVALCQFLPGPASSQVGMAIGLFRAGVPGAFAAWTGFTLPSALALVLFASGLAHWGAGVPTGLLDGLKIAAVAVVAQAVWGMGRTLCPDRLRATVALACACLTLALPSVATQLMLLVAAGWLGRRWMATAAPASDAPLPVPLSRGTGAALLALFAVLLAGLPLLAAAFPSSWLTVFDAFYRSGALVFGGGHVVLPLLQAAVVPSGWVANDVFVAGYGAAQAVPGPLFTFAAFLGAVMRSTPNGWAGALLCLVAIFLPGMLLAAGALPFWQRLRHHAGMRGALAGVNCAVVGVLLAALYDPVWTSAIQRPLDAALALGAFAALAWWRTPPWLVVAGTALAAALAGALP